MSVLRQWGRDVINLFYPALCEGCGEELVGNEQLICLKCWEQLPETGFYERSDNPIIQRFWGRVPIVQASSMYYFNKDTRLQALLHALKYRNKPEIGILLGKRFGQRLLKTKWIREVDYLIPVPLSTAKQKKRGYNQSQSIADGLSEVLQLPVESETIIRSKNTLSQTTMSVAERVMNVKDAFGINNPSILANKHIVLIDDVLTTGATLESCANQILKEVDVKISILTIAFAIE